MTDTPTPHRATPEQWVQCEDDATRWEGATAFHCLLELRDRLAAAEQRISELEANSSAGLTGSAPAGSLVEFVAEVIGAGDDFQHWKDEARAAILAVADWLDSVGNNGSARELREEVKRHG